MGLFQAKRNLINIYWKRSLNNFEMISFSPSPKKVGVGGRGVVAVCLRFLLHQCKHLFLGDEV